MSLEEMYNGLRKVIGSVISNRDSWPFREPINEATAPMYYEIIQHPIDLSVISRKIEDQLYTDICEVQDDFKLLVNNCETYNGPRNGYTLLSYAIWRVFKRSVKRFLDIDLSYDEQVAFIYPPKPTNLATKAAIEARRKRRKRRKNRKLRALEILAKAAEEAVKCTTLRGTRTDGSVGDSPISFQSSSLFDECSKNEEEGKFVSSINGNQICFTVEALSDCDSNSNFPIHLNLNLNIGLNEENLTFKSLSEWSDYIRLNGEPVKLPQQSVILPQTPLERTSGHLHPNEIRLFRAICLEKLKQLERQSSSSSISPDERLGWSFNSDTSNSNCSPPQHVEHHKPIVIKLSRCNSDNGTIWKPVQTNENESFHPPNYNTTGKEAFNGKPTCKSPNHGKNIHPRNSVGEEGLKCVPNKRVALDDDVFCHRFVNDFNTQASSSSSSGTSSSDESNSSQPKQLLNFVHPNNSYNNNQHLCLSEDSSMDSSSE